MILSLLESIKEFIEFIIENTKFDMILTYINISLKIK